MILTTTPSIEGKSIREYRGVVTGEAILGANLVKDLFAGIRDLIGGRSAAYEQELAKARSIALEELEQAARDLGANAVVGIDLDYEVLGGKGSMLMVSVSGTAVVIFCTGTSIISDTLQSNGDPFWRRAWRDWRLWVGPDAKNIASE